jgi:hypothetical protein
MGIGGALWASALDGLRPRRGHFFRMALPAYFPDLMYAGCPVGPEQNAKNL